MRLASTVLVVVLSTVLCSWSAEPPGYYDAVSYFDAASMRITLHEVIDDHVRLQWDPGTGADIWDAVNLADEDPADYNRVLDVYRNASHPKSDGESSYGLEHAWPTAYGFPNNGDENYPYTDAHHVFACDVSYDVARQTKPYRTCTDAACSEWPTERNNGQGGPGESNWTFGALETGTWEAWPGRRGDVARALLYLDVRYEGGVHGATGHPEPDLILTDVAGIILPTGGNAPVGRMGILGVLLEWNAEDPPDAVERRRNDVIQDHQGNRNPFVDHPEWARCVWGDECEGIFSDGFESGDTRAWSATVG